MDMSHIREAQLREAIRRAILPRGTNSAKPTIQNFSPPTSGTKTKLVDVNKRRPGFMIATEVSNHKPTLLKKQAFLRARHNQTIRGQAETVEQHMSMTKPVVHRYPEPIKAHDYADDWTRPIPNQKELDHREFLKSVRKGIDNSTL